MAHGYHVKLQCQLYIRNGTLQITIYEKSQIEHTSVRIIHANPNTLDLISWLYYMYQVGDTNSPNIWRVSFPTMLPGWLARTGPKHSTSVSSSAEVAVPLSVDKKEVALGIPNPDTPLAVKALPGPQLDEAPAVLCGSRHSLPSTLQVVTPFLSPVTLQVKIIIPPGQVGGAAVSWPATLSEVD